MNLVERMCPLDDLNLINQIPLCEKLQRGIFLIYRKESMQDHDKTRGKVFVFVLCRDIKIRARLFKPDSIFISKNTDEMSYL